MKVAIVGCGQIADPHVQEVRRLHGPRVTAVCDASALMAEQLAVRFGIGGVYSDLDAMLAAERPDVVHVTTPPASHLSIGKRVVAAGAHAYIEKPFTVTSAEAEELVDCAERAGRLLCVGHSYAFDSPVRRLVSVYGTGALGRAVHVDAVMGYGLSGPFGSLMMGDPSHWIHALPGGLAQNNIPHPLSLVLPFLPDPQPRVRAVGLRWRKERFGDLRDRFYDELRIGLEGANTTATIVFSCHARPIQLMVTVHGTRAQATASVDSRSLTLVTGAALPGPFARVQWAFRASRQARREAWGRLADLAHARLHYFEGMHELIRRFYLAIEGRCEMPIPMSEAVRTSRIVDEVLRAAGAEPER